MVTRQWFRASLCCILTLGVVLTTHAEVLVAKVNGEGITRARLDAAVNARMQKLGSTQAISNPCYYKQIRQQILNSLIEQVLLWQEAERQGFVVEPEEVDRTVERIRKQYKSEQMFRVKLETSGLTEETLREDLKRQLSVRRWIQQRLAREITISPEEIHQFYTANPDKFTRPEEIRARHILIKLNRSADQGVEKQAYERMHKILAEARGGADFAELATTYSEGPSASKGGDLGFFGHGRMVGPFEEAAFALQPGEISEVVHTRFGLHIIKLEARRGGEVVADEQAAAQIETHLRSAKVPATVRATLERLRQAGTVEVFAQ